MRIEQNRLLFASASLENQGQGSRTALQDDDAWILAPPAECYRERIDPKRWGRAAARRKGVKKK